MKSEAFKLLPGTHNHKIRRLYHALLAHYKHAACPMCKSYVQYGCTIVKGDLYEHLEDIAGHLVDEEDMAKLEGAGLINVEEVNAHQHRIVFIEQVAEEQAV